MSFNTGRLRTRQRKRPFYALKKPLLLGWIFFHLAFIILINANGSYSAYNQFNQKPNTFAPFVAATKLFNTMPCRYYGRYTGAETGYGFFGINVRSNGILIAECGGNGLTADFNSYETSLRFFSMANALTDDFMKTSQKTDSLKLAQGTDYMRAFSNLVLKNIAVKMYQVNSCPDSVISLSYNLLSYPTLAAVNKGTPKRYQLTKLISVTYRLK